MIHLAADLLVICGDFNGNSACVVSGADARDVIVVDENGTHFAGIELAEQIAKSTSPVSKYCTKHRDARPAVKTAAHRRQSCEPNWMFVDELKSIDQDALPVDAQSHPQ